MTQISVILGDPYDPQVTALLQQSHALMESLFPAESNHYLSVDALCTPDIRFFVAKDGDVILGCGALATKKGYGEIKSLFTDPVARGKGIARQIMQYLEREAVHQGFPMLRLETGNLLKEAHQLYAGLGYKERGPFADYPDDPNSLFMEKVLGG